MSLTDCPQDIILIIAAHLPRLTQIAIKCSARQFRYIVAPNNPPMNKRLPFLDLSVELLKVSWMCHDGYARLLAPHFWREYNPTLIRLLAFYGQFAIIEEIAANINIKNIATISPIAEGVALSGNKDYIEYAQSRGIMLGEAAYFQKINKQIEKHKHEINTAWVAIFGSTKSKVLAKLHNQDMTAEYMATIRRIAGR